MSPLDTRLAGALWRVWQTVDRSTDRAHAERREMLESARRSIGQRVRYTRIYIERARQCVDPLFCNKEPS